LEPPESEKEMESDEFTSHYSTVFRHCVGSDGKKAKFANLTKQEVSLYCVMPVGTEPKFIPSFFHYLDDETGIAPTSGGYNMCMKRMDVTTLNLKSSETYTNPKPIPEVHLFVFNFDFKIPEKISVSEGNADKGTATLQFRKDKSKETTTCKYAGGSPTVKKGQPRPIATEFKFVSCSNGAVANAIETGAWFKLTVNGNTQLSGATKTEAQLTLQRESEASFLK
jgi:hypothetical protein